MEKGHCQHKYRVFTNVEYGIKIYATNGTVACFCFVFFPVVLELILTHPWSLGGSLPDLNWGISKLLDSSGWLMCSTGSRTMGRPVNSVNAFVNQQLLTHIVMHKMGPMQGPLHQHVSVGGCQTVRTGLAFGYQALMPPSQSLFLTVWAETWTRGSRKWSWCWVVAFPRPPPLLVFLSIHWHLIHALDSVLGNTVNGLSRAHMATAILRELQYWL